MAREVEAAETEEEAERAFKTVAKQKPKGEPKRHATASSSFAGLGGFSRNDLSIRAASSSMSSAIRKYSADSVVSVLASRRKRAA
jgi:hypothetical protein